MSDSRSARADRIRHLLATESDQVKENTRHFNDDRYRAIDEVGPDKYEQYRTEARATKEDAINRLPELVDRTRATVEARGGTVYVADDAVDAREHVADRLAAEDTDSVVKSKSMTTEEIELNEALQDDGLNVWETDLGEFVIQVAEETPSHIVGPSLHKSREEITELFETAFEPDEPLDSAQKLTRSPANTSASGSRRPTPASPARTSCSPRAGPSSWSPTRGTRASARAFRTPTSPSPGSRSSSPTSRRCTRSRSSSPARRQVRRSRSICRC
jgi:hypothetical protein